jgi:hypothetical protein
MDALLPVATYKTGKSIEILSRTWPVLTHCNAQQTLKLEIKISPMFAVLSDGFAIASASRN